jgi:hypothetical protein
MSAIFPAAVATQIQLLTAQNNTSVVLNVNAGIGDTTITLANASGLPASGYLTFADNESNPETIYYTGISGANLTGVTRGADNTSATTHTAGATLEQRWNAAYHNTLTLEIAAIEQNLSDRFGLDSGTHIIAAVNGAVGAPTYSFTNSPTTGLYRAGTDILGIATAGVLAVTVNASQQVTIPKTSNQLILGTTNTVTISATAPASSQTYTIPDPGGAASFVMTAGTQTIAGAKTFSGAATFSTSITMSGTATIAMGGNKITGIANGTASTDAAAFGQIPTVTPVNILDNGGFDIWVRGTSFSSPISNGAYTADRWKFNTDGSDTYTVTQDTTQVEVGSGSYDQKLNITALGGSATFTCFTQIVENYLSYAGKTVTLTVRVKCSATGLIQAQIYDGVGQTNSSTNATTGWETLTVTATVSSSATQLTIRIGFLSGLGGTTAPSVSTIYVDSAMLVLGSVATAFVPTNPQQDLARCERFYQRIGGIATNEMIATAQAVSTTEAEFPLRFRTPMRAAPTLTINGITNLSMAKPAGSAQACISATSGYVTTQGCYIDVIVAANMVAGSAALAISTSTAFFIEFSADL